MFLRVQDTPSIAFHYSNHRNLVHTEKGTSTYPCSNLFIIEFTLMFTHWLWVQDIKEVQEWYKRKQKMTSNFLASFFVGSNNFLLNVKGRSKLFSEKKIFVKFNPLNANFTKWSNTFKQFVSNLPTSCLSVFDHFVGLALKGLNQKNCWSNDIKTQKRL